MAILIQAQFDSAVVEANKDVFTQTYIEEGNTIIEFDMRKRYYRQEFGTESGIYWSGKAYNVDIHEFSTFHNPIIYRFIVAQGYYFNKKNARIWFTPEIKEVSTRQHVSKSVIRLCCFLVVMCGVSLRNISTVFTALFMVPVTKSTVKRWIDEVGDSLPCEEEILKRLTDLKSPNECHIDAYYPLGTNRCVMVIKDEFDRILITREADSEKGDEAKKFLQKVRDLNLNITSAFSDYSKSLTEAIRAVFPDVKFQADHFHTVRNIWKHLRSALSRYRISLKKTGESQNDPEMIHIAPELWKLRWSLLKKTSNLTDKEKQAIEKLQNEDTFTLKFRSIIRQIVNILDRSDI